MSIKKKFIGLMSGTSADSIDAVLIALGYNKFEILLTHSIKISADIREEIYSLAVPGSNEIHRLSKLDKCLGLLFSQAANVADSNYPIYTGQLVVMDRLLGIIRQALA